MGLKILVIAIAVLFFISGCTIPVFETIDCGASDTCINQSINSCEPAIYNKDAGFSTAVQIEVLGLNEDETCQVNLYSINTSTGGIQSQVECAFPDYQQDFQSLFARGNRQYCIS